MKRVVALCLVFGLLLGGCANNDPPAVRACRAQADDDPEVRRMVAAGAGSEAYALQHYYELRDVRQQAELKCLRARGLAAPGGVERPKRTYNLFDGLF